VPSSDRDKRKFDRCTHPNVTTRSFNSMAGIPPTLMFDIFTVEVKNRFFLFRERERGRERERERES